MPADRELDESLLPAPDVAPDVAPDRAAARRRRELSIYCPMALVVIFFLSCSAAAVFLLFPTRFPLAGYLGFAANDPTLFAIALSITLFSALAPLLLLLLCVWRVSPSRSARARDAVFADARLEEICSSAAALREC